MEMKFLDEFNSIFGTQLKESNQKYTMLIQLVHDFVEQSIRNDELYKSIISKIVDIEDELQNNLTDEGKEIFKKWELYRDELSNYESEQSFIFGYCLDKELNVEKHNHIIRTIKEKYPQGTRIELIKMYDIQAVPPHTKGTVTNVDDIGTIHITWDNGSTLGLVEGKDNFKIIKDD